jgi:hypothetical protein
VQAVSLCLSGSVAALRGHRSEREGASRAPSRGEDGGLALAWHGSDGLSGSFNCPAVITGHAGGLAKVCLVLSTASGRGDPDRRSPTQHAPERSWSAVEPDSTRGLRPPLRQGAGLGNSSGLGFGQRLGVVCLHLLATCTFSVSLCVHQSSLAQPGPSSPTGVYSPHVSPRPPCTPRKARNVGLRVPMSRRRPQRACRPPTHPHGLQPLRR